MPHCSADAENMGNDASMSDELTSVNEEGTYNKAHLLGKTRIESNTHTALTIRKDPVSTRQHVIPSRKINGRAFCLLVFTGFILMAMSGPVLNEISKARFDTSDSKNTTTADIKNTTAALRTAPTSKITTIHLLGERNSGTNYVEQVLKEAFYPLYATHTGRLYPFAGTPNHTKVPLKQPVNGRLPVFGFKHMFRHGLLSDAEMEELHRLDRILWILVVRNPCDWADGMFRKPWHMCPPDNGTCPSPYIGINKAAVAGMTRADFFRLPWNDYVESKQQGNFSYRNIFDLRKNKLEMMRQVIHSVGPRNVKIAHLKNVEQVPERFIQDLKMEFGLHLREGYRPQRPSNKKHSTLCLTSQEWEIAQSEIDWELEGQFGFNSLDCHMCSRYLLY